MWLGKIISENIRKHMPRKQDLWWQEDLCRKRGSKRKTQRAIWNTKDRLSHCFAMWLLVQSEPFD